MFRKKIISEMELFFAALIWGGAFVAQKHGLDNVGPYTLNGVRSILAFLFLVVLAFVFDKSNKKKFTLLGCSDKKQIKSTLLGGLLCGLALTIATTVQQVGIVYTSAGKAGFITATYIVITPVLAMFLGKKTSLNVWISIVISFIGFGLLCYEGDMKFSVGLGEILVLISAFFYAVHILVVDKFANSIDNVRLSCIQFFVCSVCCSVLMFIFEKPNITDILNAWLPICYAGIMSGGVAYTLQILGQKNTPPSISVLLLSLESVFSLLFGWILLKEQLSNVELLGCLVVFIAVILAQFEFGFKKSNKKEK